MILIAIFLLVIMGACCDSGNKATIQGGEGEVGTEAEETETNLVRGGLAGAPTTSFIRASAGGGEVIASETFKAYVSLSSLSYQKSSKGGQFAVGDPVQEAGLKRVLEGSE